MKERNLIQLEKQIKTKIRAIDNGTLTPKESGIGKLMNLLKPLDEPLYDELISIYKQVLKNKR